MPCCGKWPPPHNGRLLRAEEDMAEAFWRGENYPFSVRQGIKAEKLSKMGYGDDKNEFMRAVGEKIAFWVLKSLRDLRGGRKKEEKRRRGRNFH